MGVDEMHPVTGGRGTDFAAEVAAQNLILTCILSRMALNAAAAGYDSPNQWLDAVLNQADEALERANLPPLFVAKVRSRAAGIISGSVPIVKTPAKPKPDRGSDAPGSGG